MRSVRRAPLVPPCREDVKKENAALFAALPGRAATYTSVDFSAAAAAGPGEKEFFAQLENTLQLVQELDVKVGMQVMLLANDLGKGLCNGSRGVVVGFEDHGGFLDNDNDDNMKEYLEAYGGSSSETELSSREEDFLRAHPTLPVVQFANGLVEVVQPTARRRTKWVSEVKGLGSGYSSLTYQHSRLSFFFLSL